MRLGQVFLIFCVFAIGRGAVAQDGTTWLQIEARPSLSAAEDRARDYATRLDDVSGFRLPSGWYAIALGPYAAEDAPAVLSNLRANGLIPRDSYLADGSDFGVRFWPKGAGFTNLTRPTDQTENEQPLVDNPEPARTSIVTESTFTLSDARADERALTRQDREELQRALKYEGVYNGAIDGAFGPGTRRAISAWQLNNARPDWGYLAPDQREALLKRYRDDVGALGLASVADEEAGIEITLPTGVVSFDSATSPFSRYRSEDGSDTEVLLISQRGDRTTLAALFDVMQTLKIVPAEGPRRLRGDSFTIEGNDGQVSSTTFARLDQGEIKGYTLIWPVGDEIRRDLILTEMRDSFRPISGSVLPVEDIVSRQDGPNYVAGLEIRRPVRGRSGFFVSDDGQVLTTTEAVGGCGRITLGEDSAAQIAAVDADTGMVLLTPTVPLAPMRVAQLANASAAQLSEVAVSGFSYEGALGAPSITFGQMEDPSGFGDRSDLARLGLTAAQGDSGGPVVGADGAVLGMLLPRDDETRRLPENISLAVRADRVAEFLSEAGVSMDTAVGGPALEPEVLATLSGDMTVLVSCWN